MWSSCPYSDVTNYAKRYILDEKIVSAETRESQNNFAELMHRASKGDREAQTEICNHYEPKVRVVARVLLGPALRTHFDSLDLVQSVHRSLLIGLRNDKFDVSSPEKLIALANTIVRRKVARKWRRALSYERIEHRLSDNESLVQTLSSISQAADDPVAQAEYQDQVAKICENLTEIERRMLELRLAGYTSGEVAKTLGIQMVALRVRWHRMRQRLEAAGIVAEWF